jgi:alkanesulfonate monooxygenase SsuD/methylene tetrahydromethanopterin reductase-like flavin-dependent oxidoreductase (luciferase family)
MALSGLYAKSFPAEVFTRFRIRFAGGHGVYPLIGSPDDLADEMERLSRAGFAGTVVNFVDYVAEFPYFRDEVLPRLAAKGLR